ncbi:hypothetical protein [Streptomyces sp. 142MFCol3.1]|uniref:hypothetical protein n=1 Tax=Streptomyces sp. 142MFCol3.1 TaxID=1172179 RepID=UPI000D1AF6ED|nr:hypothetical protein [Streptomyces sp. 142MFCol3.1]
MRRSTHYRMPPNRSHGPSPATCAEHTEACRCPDASTVRVSGPVALSGTAVDTRDVRSSAAGDHRGALALDVVTHHCRRATASMAASLERLDALVFHRGRSARTSPWLREEVRHRLAALGVEARRGRRSENPHPSRPLDRQRSGICDSGHRRANRGGPAGQPEHCYASGVANLALATAHARPRPMTVTTRPRSALGRILVRPLAGAG